MLPGYFMPAGAVIRGHRPARAIAADSRHHAVWPAAGPFVQHQIAMEKIRHRQIKRAIQQNLSRGADQQIRAAHDLGDAASPHRPPRRRVDTPARRRRARPRNRQNPFRRQIFVRPDFHPERNRLAIRDTEAPGEFGCRLNVESFRLAADASGLATFNLQLETICPGTFRDKSVRRRRSRAARGWRLGCPCANRCRDK